MKERETDRLTPFTASEHPGENRPCLLLLVSLCSLVHDQSLVVRGVRLTQLQPQCQATLCSPPPPTATVGVPPSSLVSKMCFRSEIFVNLASLTLTRAVHISLQASFKFLSRSSLFMSCSLPCIEEHLCLFAYECSVCVCVCACVHLGTTSQSHRGRVPETPVAPHLPSPPQWGYRNLRSNLFFFHMGSGNLNSSPHSLCGGSP